MTNAPTSRIRGDLCPGVLRPWSADDGSLVRLRLPGGHLHRAQLDALLDVAERFGDGDVHLTSRANLQVRGLPDPLPKQVVAAFEATGLLPSRSHELVRNVLMSPQSGFAGGRADLRPVVAELDRLLLATPELGALPGRFLFVLDDGRGDLVDRSCDLGVVALDANQGQLRVGDMWGPVIPLDAAAAAMADLALAFLKARGAGPTAAWHLRELAQPLTSADPSVVASDPPVVAFDPSGVDDRVPAPIPPLSYGRVAGGVHHQVPGGLLSRSATTAFRGERTLVVTPWRGIFVPDSPEQP